MSRVRIGAYSIRLNPMRVFEKFPIGLAVRWILRGRSRARVRADVSRAWA